MTGYITKAEMSGIQDIWNEVARKRAFMPGSLALGPEACVLGCGLYEASNLLVGEQLCGKSDSIQWIDAAFPHKRKRRVKNHEKLEELQNKNRQSSDIFENNLIDKYYYPQ